MGILFAFVAMFAWGLGDFLIQKSTRAFGKWAALFFITSIAAVVLFPFVYRDIITILWDNRALFILLAASVAMFFASLFDFQALKDGKMSVVEPIYALEIPVTALLAAFLISENLSPVQILLVLLLMTGIFLVSLKSLHHLKQFRLERGVVMALLSALGMGATNFLFGVGAREINPLFINWFTSLLVSIITLVYIAGHSRRGEIIRDWKNNRLLIIGVGFVDNAAWIAYSYSTLFIPITIATGISEAYIAIGALLGLFFNRETLRRHQILGLVITVASAIVLAFITNY